MDQTMRLQVLQSIKEVIHEPKREGHISASGIRHLPQRRPAHVFEFEVERGVGWSDVVYPRQVDLAQI